MQIHGEDHYTYSTFNLGSTHVIEPNFTLGLVIEDH